MSVRKLTPADKLANAERAAKINHKLPLPDTAGHPVTALPEAPRPKRRAGRKVKLGDKNHLPIGNDAEAGELEIATDIFGGVLDYNGGYRAGTVNGVHLLPQLPNDGSPATGRVMFDAVMHFGDLSIAEKYVLVAAIERRLTQKEIAVELDCSQQMVSKHVRAIRAKAGILFPRIRIAGGHGGAWAEGTIGYRLLPADGTGRAKRRTISAAGPIVRVDSVARFRAWFCRD